MLITSAGLPQTAWRKERMILDVTVGSAPETAIGTSNLRACAATDLTGRDGLSN
jgi:hypothetical protein